MAQIGSQLVRLNDTPCEVMSMSYELLFDELRQAIGVSERGFLRAEGLAVFKHDPMRRAFTLGAGCRGS